MRAMPHRSLGERMRAARQRAKLSLEAVGKALALELGRKRAFTAQAVQQWEKDNTEPNHATLSAFARLTQVNTNWLLTGMAIDQLAGGGNDEFGTTVRGGRVVPKISVLEAIEMPQSYNAEEYVHTHFACSDKAYAIDVFDTRNAPEFIPDIHRVVIDPNETPRPGDMVLARIDGAAVFGKYTRKKAVVIEALNDDWDDLTIVPERGDRVIGVMTEHAKPRRR